MEEAPVPQAGWRTHLQKPSSYCTPIHGTCTSSHSPVVLPSSTPRTCISSWHTSTRAGWSLLPRDGAGTTALGHLLCRASSASLLVAMVGLAQVQGDPECSRVSSQLMTTQAIWQGWEPRYAWMEEKGFSSASSTSCWEYGEVIAVVKALSLTRG